MQTRTSTALNWANQQVTGLHGLATREAAGDFTGKRLDSYARGSVMYYVDTGLSMELRVVECIYTL